MTSYPTRLLAALASAGCLLLAPAAQAISLYSVSDSVSASVGSISDSVHDSSRAMHVAEGDYKVLDVAQAADKPGHTRLTLQAANDSQQAPFYLYLPEHDARQAALARGDTISASKRPFGLAFARAHATTPFVLVLDQAWQQELQPNIVS